MPDSTLIPFPAPLRPEIQSIETSGIAQVFELGFGRDKLIPLWVGEGDLPTPAFICDAASAALRAGETFYAQKRGLPELREAIADYGNRLYGTALEAARISVTGSGMNAIMMTLQAMVRPGDRVAVVTPVWPNILSAIQIAGGALVPVLLEPAPEGGFKLDLNKLAAAITGGVRAVFIASPGNPTGWLLEAEEQRAILELCRKHGTWLIADEVYARFTYDRPFAPSFLQLAEPEDPLIVINSFSKAWAMTGWRLGWLTHPPTLADTFDRLIEFNTSGAQAFLQRGALAALNEGEPFVAEMVARCRTGGELVFQRLSALPRLRLARPQGAFYAFFAVEGLTDSLAFAKEILARSNIGLAPGSAFGPGGEGHLRLCFASSSARLAEAMDRLVPIFS